MIKIIHTTKLKAFLPIICVFFMFGVYSLWVFSGFMQDRQAMEVTPPPLPILPSALQQDAVLRSLPQVQAQATAPVLAQRAVAPTTKTLQGEKSRSNEGRAKGGRSPHERGASVNIKV